MPQRCTLLTVHLLREQITHRAQLYSTTTWHPAPPRGSRAKICTASEACTLYPHHIPPASSSILQSIKPERRKVVGQVVTANVGRHYALTVPHFPFPHTISTCSIVEIKLNAGPAGKDTMATGFRLWTKADKQVANQTRESCIALCNAMPSDAADTCAGVTFSQTARCLQTPACLPACLCICLCSDPFACVRACVCSFVLGVALIQTLR